MIKGWQLETAAELIAYNNSIRGFRPAKQMVGLSRHSSSPAHELMLSTRFDFGGSTIINTNKHIRLTQDRKSQAGWLWSRLVRYGIGSKGVQTVSDARLSPCRPQPLTPASFEVEWEFKVDGKSNTLFGDGFAVWLTKDRAQFGPVYGAPGMLVSVHVQICH